MPDESKPRHATWLPCLSTPGPRQEVPLSAWRILGPAAFAQWMLGQKSVLITDTSMRDAHQSLLATRIRSYDILRIAPVYAEYLPELLSLECWGGATFDVAMRFS